MSVAWLLWRTGSASDNWTPTAQVLQEKKCRKVKVGEARENKGSIMNCMLRLTGRRIMIWCIVLVHMFD